MWLIGGIERNEKWVSLSLVNQLLVSNPLIISRLPKTDFKNVSKVNSPWSQARNWKRNYFRYGDNNESVIRRNGCKFFLPHPGKELFHHAFFDMRLSRLMFNTSANSSTNES